MVVHMFQKSATSSLRRLKFVYHGTTSGPIDVEHSGAKASDQ